MESNKYLPNKIGESRIGTYYINPLFSLKVDNELRTIWLDLETDKKYFTKKPVSGYTYPVIRKTLGKKGDFILSFNPNFSQLFQIFKNIQIPIPKIIEILLNPEIIQEDNPQMSDYIKEFTQNLGENERKELMKFSQFVQNIPKESMPRLLGNSKFSLLFGNLTQEEEIQNTVITQKSIDLKKHNITVEDIKDCFGGVVLSHETYNEVFVSVGLKDILMDPPKMPETGGAIFIDLGGTGKSMIKSSLKKLWKEKLDGACIEKNGIAEFDKGKNYAALIRSWYYGDDSSEQGYDKKGLFYEAVENKVPSLLIIDEADRFVKSSNQYYRDEAADLIINEFKRYLADKDKGGVLGYVVTVFIANVDEKDLNPQLSMGGERLRKVYFGPPTTKQDWLDLIDIYFQNKRLEFNNRDKKKDSLLSDLILNHNLKVKNEQFMVTPRKFGSDFCGSYLKTYYKEDVVSTSGSRFQKLFTLLHSGRENQDMNLDYNEFLKHFIDDLLLKEIRLAGLDVQRFREEYYQFVGLSTANETDSSQTNQQQNQEFRDFMEIFQDEDVQRIIKAQDGYEILGVSKNSSQDEKIQKFRLLISKIRGGRDSYAEFNKKRYESDTCIQFINQLNQSVTTYNPNNKRTDLSQKHNQSYSYFINYAQQNMR